MKIEFSVWFNNVLSFPCKVGFCLLLNSHFIVGEDNFLIIEDNDLSCFVTTYRHIFRVDFLRFLCSDFDGDYASYISDTCKNCRRNQVLFGEDLLVKGV